MKKVLAALLLILVVCTVLLFSFKTNNKSFKQNMKIESKAFDHNGIIPQEYTCDGVGTNPPLVFSGVPADAKSLALIIDDPDAPSGNFVHWILWNILPETAEILSGVIPPGTVIGKNSAHVNAYTSPCPPSGVHRYFFKLYALDANLEISNDSTKAGLLSAMSGHILANSELVGRYGK